MHGSTVHGIIGQQLRLGRKKKGKHRKKNRGRANRNPNTYKSFGSKLPQMSKEVKIGDQTAKTFPHQLIRIYPFNLQ